MSEARQLISRFDYLSMERENRVRHEWVGGALFAMVGASGVHVRLTGRVFAALLPMADAHGCRAYASDMRVMTEHVGYYPDVMVACGEQPDPYFETAPCLLVEVLSPTTRDIDQREKLAAYKAIPSLRHYLIVHQDQPRVAHHFRFDDGDWQLEIVGPIDTIELTCPPVGIPLGELFDGLVE